MVDQFSQHHLLKRLSLIQLFLEYFRIILELFLICIIYIVFQILHLLYPELFKKLLLFFTIVPVLWLLASIFKWSVHLNYSELLTSSTPSEDIKYIIY